MRHEVAIRYSFGFILACAIGMMLSVGCSDARPTKCESAADCNDGDDCTADTCEFASGACRNPPVADEVKCDFGGLPGLCMSGVCEEDLCDRVECDDDDECTDDACNPANGTCGYAPAEDDTACDFNGFPGLCKAGVCEDANLCEGIECDDDNECTDDGCDRATGACSSTPVDDGTQCDDGARTCVAGICSDACVNSADADVYSELTYVNDDGVTSTGTDATEAIGADCVFGAPSTVPPEGCTTLASQVIACSLPGSCPPALIQEFGDCVELCMQDTIESISGSRLTENCAACYGTSTSCGADNCTIPACRIPASPVCIECRCDAGCIPSFVLCSGIPTDKCN